MFHKEENYYLTSGDTNSVLGAVQQALIQRGVAPPTNIGMGITTVAPPAGSGVNPRVQAMLFPHQGGAHLKLSVDGDIDSGSMTTFVVLMIFFWPVAVYLAYMAHQSFQNASNDLLATMRHSIMPFVQNQGGPQPLPRSGTTNPGPFG